MSTRNPTTKRILKEAAELANAPSADYHASPLETDLHEWHFTIRGPPAPSPYSNGMYHGRIILPPAYPLKPPSFRFLTPSGRFEVNREICLSISGHHEETWQPAWGIRTALVAIRSFMESEAGGQVGGMEASDFLRKRLAASSPEWRCGACGKSNGEVMKEQEAASLESDTVSQKEERIPEGLRLDYRENLTEKTNSTGEVKAATKDSQASAGAPSLSCSSAHAPTPTVGGQSADRTRTSGAERNFPRPRQTPDEMPVWIDKAIFGVLGALLFLLWRKFVI